MSKEPLADSSRSRPRRSRDTDRTGRSVLLLGDRKPSAIVSFSDASSPAEDLHLTPRRPDFPLCPAPERRFCS